MSGHEDAPSTKDARVEFFKLVGLVLGCVLGLVVVPVLIPEIIIRRSGHYLAPRARFWVVQPWRWALDAAGVLLYAVLVLIELSKLVPLVRTGALLHTVQQPNGWGHLLVAALPWLIVNLLAGVLFVPLLLTLYRRRLAHTIRDRRHEDVMMQERIETARVRAADIVTARRVGVKLDPRSGKITGVTPRVVTAPRPVTDGAYQFGIINVATIRTLVERAYDVRRIRDWTHKDGRSIVMPRTASAARAIVIAESGSGKTVLLVNLILCALMYGWPIVFIDAKGDPDDARSLKNLVESLGFTATINEPWNLFTGTADQVTEKLMRLWPSAPGGEFYELEARGVLQAIQHRSPLRSLADLGERVRNPNSHVAGPDDAGVVNAKTREGVTAGERVYNSIRTFIGPLDKWLSDDGWSYGERTADVTIMSIVPVESAQAKLADLLLMDLRNYMADRLRRGDKSPLLVEVDEFPQLVTDSGVDAGDTASTLFEVARSAGMGLIIAGQSGAGLSNDEVRRRRALSSGAALIIGRSKDPEDIVRFAGTQMQMEASGAAAGDELRSARAQHTWIVDPNDVRTASDGSFWIVQNGAAAPFRVLPNPKPKERTEEPAPTSENAIEVEPEAQPNLWVRGADQ